MKLSTSVLLAVVTLGAAQKGVGKGSGPYKAHYYEEPSLPKHVFYAPTSQPPGLKLPVLIWGNGGCSGNGTLFWKSLSEVSSRGVLVISAGTIKGMKGMTSGLNANRSPLHEEALAWVAKNAGTGKYANVDKTRLGAAGQSCGGLETYRVRDHPLVKVIGIFNSGQLNSNVIAKSLTKPAFYFLGGPSDIAYKNGENDYKNIRSGVPAWIANYNVGHMGTYRQENGGKFGKAMATWADWTLRGNPKAGDWFLKGGAKADGWVDVRMKSMNQFKVPAQLSP